MKHPLNKEMKDIFGRTVILLAYHKDQDYAYICKYLSCDNLWWPACLSEDQIISEAPPTANTFEVTVAGKKLKVTVEEVERRKLSVF